jgi:integrase
MDRYEWTTRLALELGFITEGSAPATEAKQSPSGDTFGRLLRDWIAATYAPSSLQYVRVSDFISRLVLPSVGDNLLQRFRDDDLRRVLDDIGLGQGKRATSRLCRMWIRSALRLARTQKRITRDAYAELMEVGPVRHRTSHKRPLRPEEIRVLWHDIGQLDRQPTVLGLRILLLTFVRPVELIRARWEEFDLTGVNNEGRPTWIVPAYRVKMRTPHIVPLAPEVVGLLRKLRRISGQSPLLFPSATGERPVSRQAWADAIRYIDWGGRFSPHAARATASTLLRELELGQNDHIEIQLGHLHRSNVRASYDFATCLRQRREMMRRWARYITNLVSDRQATSRRMPGTAPRTGKSRDLGSRDT